MNGDYAGQRRSFLFPHDLFMFVLLNFMGWVLHSSYSVYRIDRVVAYRIIDVSGDI